MCRVNFDHHIDHMSTLPINMIALYYNKWWCSTKHRFYIRTSCKESLTT